MKDTTIMYQGGSGGFMLYYAMLSTGKFTTGRDISDVAAEINKQFPQHLKQDPDKWKETEIWPDNSLCKNDIADRPRLFLVCNPTFNCTDDQFVRSIVDGTEIILLYTDLRTQLRLAYDKRAYWFTELSQQKFKHSETQIGYIKSILKSGVLWRGEVCDPALPVIEKLYAPSQVIKLQDFLTLPGYKHITDKWVALHSKKAVRRL